MENYTGLIVGISLFVVAVVLIALTWRKAPQDKAFIVTGLKKRVLTGQGGLVIPFFEQVDKLSLENMKVDVTTNGSLDSNGVPINTQGVSIFKISSNKEDVLKATEQFNTGNQKDTINEIKDTVQEVLEGKLREILSKMTVEEIYKDREMFANQIEAVAKNDLEKMGLQIQTFTIKDIDDDNGYLVALGAKQIAEVKKNAAIAQANANKEMSEKTAEANRLAKEATLVAETKIAEAEKEKQLKIEAFKIEKEEARAKADIAYEVEQNKVKKQAIETEKANELLKEKRQTEIAEQQAIKKERELEASIKKQAEADKFKREKESDADKYQAEKKADAEKYEIEQKAEADRLRVTLAAQAEAEAIKVKGDADASAIRAVGQATADAMKAEAEAMKEKAEAYKQYGDAAIIEILADKLPEIAKHIAEPLSKTDKMVIIDNGGNGGASQLTKNVANIMSQVPEVMESLTGVDLTGIIKNMTSGAMEKRTETVVDTTVVDTTVVE